MEAENVHNKKLSALGVDQVYEIGFADGQRGPWKRKTLMLEHWSEQQSFYYGKGHMDGQRQRLLDWSAVDADHREPKSRA